MLHLFCDTDLLKEFEKANNTLCKVSHRSNINHDSLEQQRFVSQVTYYRIGKQTKIY